VVRNDSGATNIVDVYLVTVILEVVKKRCFDYYWMLN